MPTNEMYIKNKKIKNKMIPNLLVVNIIYLIKVFDASSINILTNERNVWINKIRILL